jgi:hypothetical protein
LPKAKGLAYPLRVPGPSPISTAALATKTDLSGGNRNDITELLPLIDKIPPVRGRRGRPRRRTEALFADRAYDHDKYRQAVHSKGVAAVATTRARNCNGRKRHIARRWPQPVAVVLATCRWCAGR